MRVPFPPASKITETLRSATACIHKCQKASHVLQTLPKTTHRNPHPLPSSCHCLCITRCIWRIRNKWSEGIGIKLSVILTISESSILSMPVLAWAVRHWGCLRKVAHLLALEMLTDWPPVKKLVREGASRGCEPNCRRVAVAVAAVTIATAIALPHKSKIQSTQWTINKDSMVPECRQTR